MRSWELKGEQMLLVYFVCYKDDICKSCLLLVHEITKIVNKKI